MGERFSVSQEVTTGQSWRKQCQVVIRAFRKLRGCTDRDSVSSLISTCDSVSPIWLSERTCSGIAALPSLNLKEGVSEGARESRCLPGVSALEGVPFRSSIVQQEVQLHQINSTGESRP